MRKDKKGISKPFKDKKLKRNVKVPKDVVIFRWSNKRHVNAVRNAHANERKQTFLN